MPANGWSVAAFVVLVAFAAAIALVVLSVGAAIAIYFVRSARHAPLGEGATRGVGGGQQRVPGSPAPRITPPGRIPRPLRAPASVRSPAGGGGVTPSRFDGYEAGGLDEG